MATTIGKYVLNPLMFDNNFFKRYGVSFTNPYQYSYKPDENFVKAFQTLRSLKELKYNPPEIRTGLDRTLDALSMPLYATAGMVKGAIDPNTTVLQGMVSGIRAGNPFGQGYAPGETTYSDVLETAGWKPTSLGGKIAKGSLGFLGDVFLDPTTYLTFGVGALLKGTGKAAQMANKLKPMTQEIAEAIVIKSGKALNAEEVVSDASKLVKEYNTVLGFERDVQGVTFGLRNAPFGNKLFKKADIAKEIASSSTMEKIGDYSFAPLYQNIRKFIYGSQIGKMFGSKTTLYRLAQQDPEKVYDFVKFMDNARGFNADMNKANKIVHQKAKELFDLTPAETKEIIDALQNKNLFHTIKQTVNFSDMREAVEYKDRVLKRKKDVETIIQKLQDQRDIIDKLRVAEDDKLARELKKKNVTIESEIADLENTLSVFEKPEVYDDWIESNKGILDALMEDHAQDLMDLEVRKIDNEKQLKALIKTYQDEIAAIKSGIPQHNLETEQILNRYDNYIEQSKKARDSRLRKRAEKPQKELLFSERYHIPKTEFSSDKVYKGIVKEIKEKGYVVKKQYRRFANLHPTWMMEKVGGEYRFTPPPPVIEKITTKEGLKNAQKVMDNVYDGLEEIDKIDFIDKLSEYVYGHTGMISYDTWHGNIEEVMNMIKDGKNKKDIQKLMERKADFFSGKADIMYPFIASKVGYGKGTKFKNWDEMFTKPMKELFEKSNTVGLSIGEQKHILELQQANYIRNYWLAKFKSARTIEDAKLIVEKDANDMLDKIYDEVKDMANSTARKSTFGEDSNPYRQGFADSDSAIVEKHKDLRSKFSSDWENPQVKTSHRNVSSAKYTDDEFRIRNIHERGQLTQKIKLTDEVKFSQNHEFIDDYLKEKHGIFKEVGDNSVRYLTKNKEDKFVEVKDIASRKAFLKSLLPEVEPLLKNIFGKNYDELSYGQKDFLFNLATSNAKAKATGEGKIITSPADLKNGKNQDAVTKEFVKREAKARQEVMISQVKEGSEVTFLTNRKVVENGKDKYIKQLATGIVDEVKLGTQYSKDGYVSYTIVKRDGTLVNDVSSAHIMDCNNSKLDVAISSPTANDFLQRQKELVDLINEQHAALKLNESEYASTFRKLVEDVEDRYEATRFRIGNLEEQRATVKELMSAIAEKATAYSDELGVNKFDPKLLELEKDLDTQFERIKNIEDALASDDAFETLYKSVHGEDSIEKLIKKYNPNMNKIVLDVRDDYDIKIKKLVKEFRQLFIDIGQEEVGIGRLKPEQFEKLMNGYLPHILTPVGEEFFLSKKGEEVLKKMPNFGDEYGYGRKHSNFSESRTIKYLPDGNGGWIHNPTIEEINNFFKPMVQGKNVMSENLAEIYIARGLKHNELMYDHKYMTQMLEIFGKDYKGGNIEKGYDLVMNYGMLQKHTKDMAGVNVTVDISDDISDMLENFFQEVPEEFTLAVNKRMGELRSTTPGNAHYHYKKAFNEELGKVIDGYMKANFSDEVRNQMFDSNMKDMLAHAGMTNSLDDLAMPLLNLKPNQHDALMKASGYTQNRLLRNISGKEIVSGFGEDAKVRYKGGLISYVKGKYREMGQEPPDAYFRDLANMDAEDLRKEIDEWKTLAEDDIDLARLNRMEEKLNRYDKLNDPQIKQVNSAIVERANQARKMQIAKDQNRFLQMYDKFTHFIKLNQTTVLPSFHIRNKLSNIYLNWFAIGRDACNVDFQKQSFKAIRNKGEVDGVLDITLKDGSTTSMKWSDLYDAAMKYDVINEGYFAKDLGAGAESSVKLGKLPPKYNPLNTQNFFLYKKGKEIGGLLENQDRLIHFASQVSRGYSFEDAAKSVNKYLFDYSELTAFEQSVMKRLFPYYTWLRKNGQLQLQTLIDNPKKLQYVSKVRGGLEGMNNEEDMLDDNFLNEFALDWIQLPLSVMNKQGRREPILWNPNLPFGDLSRIPDPTRPVGSLLNLFSQSNPAIKVPIEQALNKNVFFDQPIVPEPKKGLNGEVEVTDPVSARADHILSQFGAYGVASGVAEKSGLDLGLHVFNNLTGIKMLSYDYEAFKKMKLDEMRESGFKKSFDARLQDAVKAFGGYIARGVEGQVSRAMNYIGDKATEDMPLRPGEYTGALKPISKTTYDKLSEAQKALYNPPTEEEAIAYNKQAVELSEREFQRSGSVKHFIWSLFDTLDLGERNKDYVIGSVSSVIDGDTFDIVVGDNTKRVRMLLIDTPETVKKDMPLQPVGKEASNFSKSYLIGKDVKIIFDGKSKEDTYGRMLGYVEVDGENYQNVMLSEGLAKVGYTFDPYYVKLDEYKETEKKAHDEGKGVWSVPDYAQPGGEGDFKLFTTDREAKAYTEAIRRRLAK
jgi:endonuclease YncB( thermonuclease family)